MNIFLNKDKETIDPYSQKAFWLIFVDRTSQSSTTTLL